VSERSSILLLGRNTVVIGALLITIASFGIGYFFGFKGSGSPEQEKQVAQSAKAGEVSPLEENRIIDLPVKDAAGKAPSAQASTAKQSEPVGEASGQNATEQAADQATEKAKPKLKVEAEPPGTKKTSAEITDKRDKADKISSPKLQKNETRITAAPANQATADASVQSAQADQTAKAVSAAPKNGRHAGEKAKKKSKNSGSSGKMYTVQIGAFPNKEGAEQLYKNLKASGYRPYIVNANESNDYFKVRIGTFKNKKAAEKSAAELLKKTGLQNFVTASQ
jgi:cell division protein FtsN